MCIESLKEQIWSYLARRQTPGFFITAEVSREGAAWPVGLEAFLTDRLEAIRRGQVSARKFVFTADDWRIVLTFFPTDRVVDERYALKNKVMKLRRSLR